MPAMALHELIGPVQAYSSNSLAPTKYVAPLGHWYLPPNPPIQASAVTFGSSTKTSFVGHSPQPSQFTPLARRARQVATPPKTASSQSVALEPRMPPGYVCSQRPTGLITLGGLGRSGLTGVLGALSLGIAPTMRCWMQPPRPQSARGWRTPQRAAKDSRASNALSNYFRNH